jgi:hypothetical protein
MKMKAYVGMGNMGKLLKSYTIQRIMKLHK